MRRIEHTIECRLAGLKRFACLLLLSAMSAVVLLSCGGSGDELGEDPTPQPQPKTDIPIAFSGNLAEGESESHARTRATTSPLSATHQTFHVWAYKNPESGPTETVMKNYTVNYVTGTAGTTSSNSSGWEYVNQGIEQSIKYWDFKAEDYRFFGYAGSTESTDAPHYHSTIESDGSVSVSFDVSVATNPQQDPVTLPLDASTPLYSKLWYKEKADLPAQKDLPVTLQFLQPYVKVRFLFRQSESADVVFTLTDMSFGPTNDDIKIYIKGSFKVTYPVTGETSETWLVTHASPGTEGTDYRTAFTRDYYVADPGADDDTKANEKMWYVVLPAKNQGTYVLSVYVNNESRSVVVPAQYMNWQPGYEYTYIFKITDPGGVELDGVQVGFSPWTVVTGEKDIYNW